MAPKHANVESAYGRRDESLPDVRPQDFHEIAKFLASGRHPAAREGVLNLASPVPDAACDGFDAFAIYGRWGFGSMRAAIQDAGGQQSQRPRRDSRAERPPSTFPNAHAGRDAPVMARKRRWSRGSGGHGPHPRSSSLASVCTPWTSWRRRRTLHAGLPPPGLDWTARLVSYFFTRRLPARPWTSNLPGAGSMLAADQLTGGVAPQHSTAMIDFADLASQGCIDRTATLALIASTEDAFLRAVADPFINGHSVARPPTRPRTAKGTSPGRSSCTCGWKPNASGRSTSRSPRHPRLRHRPATSSPHRQRTRSRRTTTPSCVGSPVPRAHQEQAVHASQPRRRTGP